MVNETSWSFSKLGSGDFLWLLVSILNGCQVTNDEIRNTRNNHKTSVSSTWISSLHYSSKPGPMIINLSSRDYRECDLQRLVLKAALAEQKPTNTLQDETPVLSFCWCISHISPTCFTYHFLTHLIPCSLQIGFCCFISFLCSISWLTQVSLAPF